MTLSIAGFTFEATTNHLFLRLPFVEVWARRGETICFDAWKDAHAVHWRLGSYSGNVSRVP